MARCTNCRKGTLNKSHYEPSKAGTLVTLYYTGESIGGQAITAPSGQVLTFSKLRPKVTVDGGDVKAIINLGFFRLGEE